MCRALCSRAALAYSQSCSNACQLFGKPVLGICKEKEACAVMVNTVMHPNADPGMAGIRTLPLPLQPLQWFCKPLLTTMPKSLSAYMTVILRSPTHCPRRLEHLRQQILGIESSEHPKSSDVSYLVHLMKCQILNFDRGREISCLLCIASFHCSVVCMNEQMVHDEAVLHLSCLHEWWPWRAVEHPPKGFHRIVCVCM